MTAIIPVANFWLYSDTWLYYSKTGAGLEPVDQLTTSELQDVELYNIYYTHVFYLRKW